MHENTHTHTPITKLIPGVPVLATNVSREHTLYCLYLTRYKCCTQIQKLEYIILPAFSPPAHQMAAYYRLPIELQQALSRSHNPVLLKVHQ